MERSNSVLVVLIRVTGMIPDRITDMKQQESKQFSLIALVNHNYNNLFVREKRSFVLHVRKNNEENQFYSA